MKQEVNVVSTVLVCLALIGFLPASAAAVPVEEEPPDAGQISIGKGLYRGYCVGCHGAIGEGDGPLGKSLRIAPANLTLLAKRKNGEFSFEEVVKKIDGRERVKGHGSSDMPAWGKVFTEAEQGANENQVHQRVTALAHYLRSLQVSAD